MINLKKIAFPVLILATIFSVPIINSKKEASPANISSNNNVPLTASINKAPNIKSEIHNGVEEVKKNVQYGIKSPKAKMDDLKLVDMKSDKHIYKDKPVTVVYSKYKGDNNKDLTIQQVDVSEKSPLINDDCKSVKFKDGTEAWVLDTMKGKGYIHIIFVKEGKNYDVMGFNLGEKRLIEIAESLN